MLILTKRLPEDAKAVVRSILPLTARERTRSHYRFDTAEKEVVHLRLPRGSVLQDGDLLTTETGECLVRVIAKPESVMTVVGLTPIDLLRAAYHLGNRHVPLEIAPSYLRLSPDPVLRAMLEQLGLEVREEILPFQPEIGAYKHSH